MLRDDLHAINLLIQSVRKNIQKQVYRRPRSKLHKFYLRERLAIYYDQLNCFLRRKEEVLDKYEQKLIDT